MKGKMSAEDKKWQTEDDLRTLAKAEEIKADPTRMKACQKMAAERKAQMDQVMATK